MKLLLENWNQYVNDELLVESYEDSIQSVVKNGSKFLKGWAYDNDKEAYEKITSKNGWDIAGKLLYEMFLKNSIAQDLTDKQKSIALLWTYRQLKAGKIVDINELAKAILLPEAEDIGTYSTDELLSLLSFSIITNRKNLKLIRDFDFLFSDPSQNVKDFHLFKTPKDARPERRLQLIEKFFLFNQFIRDGKKDLNSVESFQELSALVKEASPLYKKWQKEQKAKDVEAGKEELLNNQDWQIIVIHNKGAACQLGKDTDWCTAAPGLDYFKKYYKPNDPIFFITDKSINENFQFHFGSQQFMDVDNNELSPSRAHVEEEIMRVLAQVVPPKYDIAYKWLQKYK